MCPFKYDSPKCNFSTSPCDCYDTAEGIRLECNGQYLNSIPALADVPRERVISLNLYGNYITNVSRWDFCKYPALQCVDLSNNQMHMLPEDVFICSKNLSTIFFDHNCFTKIPEQIFPYNRNIEVISLRDIGPGDREATLGTNWTYLTHLREFHLTDTIFTTPLDKQFLSNLNPTGVSIVEIAGNHIPSYGESVFEYLPDLTNLSLSRLHNLYDDTTRRVLWGMNQTNLRYLLLEHNPRLRYIAKEMLEGLQGTKLDYLSLSFSRVFDIEDGAFYHTPNVLALCLQSLPITHINNRTFMYLDKLMYLTLTSCDLEHIDYAFEPLGSLLHLDISNNLQLQHLTTNAFKNLHNLKELIIRYLHLDELYTYTFTDLRNLTLLDASLLELRHKKTYMHIGDHAFHGLTNLLQLNVIHSNIATLQRAYFEPLSKVQIIKLSGNNFLDGMISRDCFQPVSSTLCRLDLDDSNINKYMLGTGFLNNLSNLQVLRLGYNNLITLPNNSFDGCSHLQHVDLQQNLLSHIPYVLKILEPLTFLSLHNNQIEYINNSAPYYDLTYLQNKVSSTNSTGFFFKLSHNPYNCSCAMVKNFIQWFNQTKVFNRLQGDRYSYECNYAPFKEMLSVALIKFNKTLCMLCEEPDNRNVVIISITVGVVYFVASILVIFCYLFQWDISWLLFLWRWKRVKEDGEDEFEYDAFICYSSKDYTFVLNELIENLEQKSKKQDNVELEPKPKDSQDYEYYRLAVDFRLFLPGGLVSDYIIDYMNRSRKTIILVSQNFLDGNWTIWEYQLAQSRALERRDKLIVVLLESVPMRKMPRGLNKLIRDRAHLEWTDNPNGQEVFWRKMRKALQKPVSPSRSANSVPSTLTEPLDPQHGIQAPG